MVDMTVGLHLKVRIMENVSARRKKIGEVQGCLLLEVGRTLEARAAEESPLI
ncbi:hypothetical protein CERSUDRAFT_82386 [Gelatoporia subvermispora B]|uniref:Uncharacterized protein n=1 Tax=Ceriporiopsis subvermispora (strain B) TaxID=914234 RepID=M2QM74_CERS8|nr:hypothetical protein CERSUDRAFT_82386 [Gelatoporia subvermispora B]